MDWQIRPLGRESTVSGETLSIGDRVECFIFLDTEGQLQRADIRESESERFPRPESVLGRWQRVVKDRGEEQREARGQILATAEDIFFSVVDHEPGAEGTDSPREEREALMQVLALMLERKRVLRSIGRVQGDRQAYLHVRSKREIEVPMGEIEPQHLLALQERLEILML